MRGALARAWKDIGGVGDAAEDPVDRVEGNARRIHERLRQLSGQHDQGEAE